MKRQNISKHFYIYFYIIILIFRCTFLLKKFKSDYRSCLMLNFAHLFQSEIILSSRLSTNLPHSLQDCDVRQFSGLRQNYMSGISSTRRSKLTKLLSAALACAALDAQRRKLSFVAREKKKDFMHDTDKQPLPNWYLRTGFKTTG